jgi:hypothetical protein
MPKETPMGSEAADRIADAAIPIQRSPGPASPNGPTLPRIATPMRTMTRTAVPTSSS